MCISWVLSWLLSCLCPRRYQQQILFHSVHQGNIRLSGGKHPERSPPAMLLMDWAVIPCKLYVCHTQMRWAWVWPFPLYRGEGWKDPSHCVMSWLTLCSQFWYATCMRSFQSRHLVVIWPNQLFVMITSTWWGSNKLDSTNFVCYCRWWKSLRAY